MVHHFERDDTIRCFHCGNIVPMKLVGRDVVTWDEGDDYVGIEEWSFYLCPTCKAPTLLCWYWQQKNGEITSKVGRSIVYPSNLFETKSVPENIRKAFMAAAATKSIDTSVSLIAWRRVLELTCKDLGAQGRNLYEKISDLSSKNILPHLLTDASNLIRLLGNEGAHSIEFEVSRVNLSNVEALVRHIIEYVYILPEKISDISNSYKEEHCEKTKPSSHTAVFFRPHRPKATHSETAPSYPQGCGKHCALLTTDLTPPIFSHFFFFIIYDGAPLVEDPNPNFARVGRGTPARLGARLKILLGFIHAAARRAQCARRAPAHGHGVAAPRPFSPHRPTTHALPARVLRALTPLKTQPL